MIALRQGGYLETVNEEHGGLLFSSDSPTDIRQAVLRHEERTRAPDPVRLRASVAPCFNDRFALRIHAIVNEVQSERSMPRTTADAP